MIVVGGRSRRITNFLMSFSTYARSRATVIVGLLLSGSVAACNPSEREPRSDIAASTPAVGTLAVVPAEPTVRPASVIQVDSVLSREEALRRFRAGVGAPPEGLAPAFHSREALVRQLVDVIERADTLGLVPLVLTRAEFAYLYYPTNPLSRPPYDLTPALMWFRLQGSNRRAALALMRVRGGTSLGYESHECTRSAREGANTIWSDCQVVRRLPDGGERSERLFGTIVERDGRYKLVALSNELQ